MDSGNAFVLVSSAPPVFVEKKVQISSEILDLENNLKNSDNLCIIKMLGSTICASDIHTADGRRPAVPNDLEAECTLGHEGIGVVVSKASNASSFAIGDIVSFAVSVSSCETSSSNETEPCG